ncbi:hypothetical protein [Streptomyces sp. NPDC001250]
MSGVIVSVSPQLAHETFVDVGLVQDLSGRASTSMSRPGRA